MVAPRSNIEDVVAICRRAAEASRTAALRKGNVVVLTEQAADEVMITADLHGHRHNFDRICKTADLDRHPRRHLVMQEVCHGGPLYPSGTGCMSHLLLEDVARLQTEFPDRFHFLLSNHELAELTEYPIVKNGKMLNLLFRCGLQEMYGDAMPQVRKAYNEFFASLPLAVRLPTGVFISHSVPEAVDAREFDAGVLDRPLAPSDLSEGGDAFRLVWGRDYRPANVEALARHVDAELFITGHEPSPDGYQVPNDRQIILDCCGHRGAYVILPLAEKLSQKEIVARIKPLD